MVSASKVGNTTTIYIDGRSIATIDDGVDGEQGPQGIQGPAGQDGYSPVRGTDYWTSGDKAEIVEEVVGEIDLTDYAQKSEIPTKVSDLTDDSGHYTKPANGIPASDLADGVIPDLTDYVKNTDYATANKGGVVKLTDAFSTTDSGVLKVSTASSAMIKNGVNPGYPIMPIRQHESTFYGLAKAAGDSTQSASDNAVGTYTDNAKTAIREMIGAVGEADLNDYVKNTDYATTDKAGVVSIKQYGGLETNDGSLSLQFAGSYVIKKGISTYTPIIPQYQHESVFYGLAKASGDSTQSQSSNAIGTYTDSAKSAIKTMLGVNEALASVEPTITASKAYAVGDLVVNNGKLYKVTAAIAQNDVLTEGTNISETKVDEELSGYVRDTDYASTNTSGVIKVGSSLEIGASGYLNFRAVGASEVKAGTTYQRALTPERQHASAFYGLAKAAGDTTQSASSNAVGTYTDNAKAAIRAMLGINEAYVEDDSEWELIREDTFTYTTPTVHRITVDGNGQPFELTDAVLMFETPVQATEASCEAGNLILTDGSSNIASVYCGGWTQAANAAAYGAWVIAENKKGLVFVYAKNRSTSTNLGGLTQAFTTGFPYGPAQSIVESENFIIRGAKIAYVLGTGHYKLYGKRKFSSVKSLAARANSLAYVELSTTATKNYAIGDLLVLNGNLYRATTAITSGDTITVGTNVSATKVADEIGNDRTRLSGLEGLWEAGSGTNAVKMKGATSASGNHAVAEGNSTTASGAHSHAEGYQTLASGGNSHTEGANSVASGARSHAEGSATLAKSASQHVFGEYNVADSDTPNAKGSYVEIVGNGASSARSNARTLDWSGNERLAGQVYVGCNSDSTGGTKLVSETDYASSSKGGAVKVNTSFGININSSGELFIYSPTLNQCKNGTYNYIAVTPSVQHYSAFYGLSKAAGVDMASSSNPVGTYTPEAKAAIKSMIGVSDVEESIVSGTDPVIVANSNTRYVCGEVTSIDFTPSSSGICDVIFTSGSTPAVLTLPNTVKLPAWFSTGTLDADTTYEINILDGIYGVVMAWT